MYLYHALANEISDAFGTRTPFQAFTLTHAPYMIAVTGRVVIVGKDGVGKNMKTTMLGFRLCADGMEKNTASSI